MMGGIAASLADAVVVTSDNPRTECPASIVAEIVGGVSGGEIERVRVEVDRAAAIRSAIDSADAGDVVLIAGKGHETEQIVRGEVGDDGRVGLRTLRFDDRAHARDALRARWLRERGVGAGWWNRGRLTEVLGGLSGVWLCGGGDDGCADAPVTGGMRGGRVVLDSREIRGGEVFVAICGKRHDGHAFGVSAVERGAGVVIVDERGDAEAVRATVAAAERRGGGVSVLRVSDSRKALLAMASAWRDVLGEHGTRVIAVAGSNGKTTAKQFVHAGLGVVLAGSAAPASFNNEIGVPMTLLSATPGESYVVCEIGTNARGEIGLLSSVARPEVRW